MLKDKAAFARGLIAVSFATLSTYVLSAEAFAQNAVPITKLSVMWEVAVPINGLTDYMTTVIPSERDSYPFFGEIAYIRSDTTTAPLYRLENGDHMDSTIIGEGGYITEGPLGSPWLGSSDVPGLSSLFRLYDPTTGDHATSVAGTQASYGSSYRLDGYFSAYAYARYGNSGQILNSYSGGGVSVGSDFVAGGAVASWTWDGVQFINTNDYGRYMQSSIFYYDSNGGLHNPTEAGDFISGSTYGAPGKWHGSPVLNNQVTNGVVLTRSIPLDFGTDSVPVTPTNPWIYPGMQIGKNITLNYNGMGPVALYQTVVVSPVAISTALVEIPTAYLNSQFGNFYSYDAAANTLSQVEVPDACQSGNPNASYAPPSGYGGVIIADAAGTHALGVYGDAIAKGGSIGTPYNLWDFRSCDNTTKWNAVYQGPISAGQNVFTSYVVSGTVNQVAALMRSLYVSGN